MEKGQIETISVRLISCAFVVLALFVFKPFGLDEWQWHAYAHLLAIFVLGFCVCMLTDVILKFVLRMPRSSEQDVSYVIRRNLWFQLINTPLIALMICLYRHFVLSDRVEANRLSWGNYLETLGIIAFCSFAIGLYWRFKFRSKYLAKELEETRLLNEQLKEFTARSVSAEDTQDGSARQSCETLSPLGACDAYSSVASLKNAKATEEVLARRPEGKSMVNDGVFTITGTTSETLTLQIQHLMYVEAVGNYVKVYHLCDGKVRSDMLRATSKQIEDELSVYPMIVRCHRAFLVNLQQVEKIVSNAGSMQLVMKHGRDSIPVSRSNVTLIKKAINSLL